MTEDCLSNWQQQLADDICNLNHRCEQGLKIYRNNYFVGHVQALKENFPATEQQLGQPTFNALAGGYCLTDGALEHDLNSFGKSFSAFLDRELMPYFHAQHQQPPRQLAQIIIHAKLETLEFERYYNQNSGGQKSDGQKSRNLESRNLESRNLRSSSQKLSDHGLAQDVY